MSRPLRGSTGADVGIVEEKPGEQRPPKRAIMDRLSDYIRAASVQFPIIIRSFTKWYFDLLKNALVIAAVSYFSEKPAVTLWFHCRISLLIFSIYCVTYLYAWTLADEPCQIAIWRRLLVYYCFRR